MTYQDILYAVDDATARITINRPDKYNAFRAQTVEELIDAFRRAAADREVAVVVLAGAGDRAFCTGGDQSGHADEGGGYGGGEPLACRSTNCRASSGTSPSR